MTRDQYVEALKNKLDEWNEQIGRTESQMKEASDAAQAHYGEQVEEMKKHAAAAEAQMLELRQNQSENWDKQRANFETAWGDIAARFGRAWSRFH